MIPFDQTPKTFIIAEAGVNHNGSIKMARQLIEVAAGAGADAVKFQTFKATQVVSQKAPKADYQLEATGQGETQLEMIKKLELDREAHLALADHCRLHEIQFLSTPFDLGSLQLLVEVLGLPLIKVPSGEITNAPLLLKVGQAGKKVILSTGMSTLGEVETALGVLAFGFLGKRDGPSLVKFQDAYCSQEGRQALQDKVTLLHCTTQYPAPFRDVNLRAMDTLGQAFNLPTGLSDHTPGIAVPIAAAARGACLIEKHFTLDKALPGPDHKASLEPGELKKMVQSIRQVEEALGSPLKRPAPSEIKNRAVARKSLVAARDIRAGERLTRENLTVKRPGGGISPLYYWDWLGRKADKNYRMDDMIK